MPKQFLLIIIPVIIIVLFFGLIRPWYLYWGATRAERFHAMPGDHLVKHPSAQMTRAITINASPDQVWPWLVQIGYQRAGWYNYDRINALMGAADYVDGSQSATRIIPELQTLSIGDKIYIAPGQAYSVIEYEPVKNLILYQGDPSIGYYSWVYVLNKTAGNTRLIVRHREFYPGLTTSLIFHLIEPGVWLQEHKHLQGIKQRAEHIY